NRLLIVPIEQRTFDEWFLFFLYEIRRFRLGSTFVIGQRSLEGSTVVPCEAYFLKAVGPNLSRKGPILQYHDWKIENLNVKMAPVATFMATLFVGLNMRKGSKRKGDESILHYTTRVREEA
ncbi:hypothetical protein ACJX0J_004641, partial (mitochondrion) [Zea mays]